jgi:hypothetical protein
MTMTATDALPHAGGPPRSMPVSSAAVPTVARGLLIFCLCAIGVGIAAALSFYLHRGSLWEDEIIAITHSNQPLPSFFIELLRNDIHPPLYFLQLDGWAALGDGGDRWALTNSLLWATISLCAVFAVTRSLHGARSAWIAAALFAVLPNFAWSAGTLRMYAALPACVLFAYYANRRWFDTRSRRWLATALVVEVATAYVHAIEFYFVGFIVLGALAEAISMGRLRVPSLQFARSVWTWLIAQIVFGLCVLPLAASALVRGSDASAPDSIGAMLTIGGSLVAGWKASGLPSARIGGSVVFVVLVWTGIAERSSRWRTLMIPVGAIFVALLIALLLKPIFKQPVFAANLLPFVVLGAATAAGRSRLALGFVVACIAMLACAAYPLASRQSQPEAYAAAAAAIRQQAVQGDVVVIPNVSVFWGITRYAVGPRWGRPLSVLPPLNADWLRLNDRLAQTFGTDMPRRLGLVPDGNVVGHDGVTYLVGTADPAVTRDARHLWVVKRERYHVDLALDPRWKESTTFVSATFGGGELEVQRYDRDDGS